MNISEFLKREKIFEYALVSFDELAVVDKRREERVRKLFKPQTAVFFLMPYYVKSPATDLSRYAHSRDYHLFVKELSERAEKCLDLPFVTFADTSPVDEVGGAVLSGLGCVGENGLIINPRYGSYVFIGEFFFPASPEHEFFHGVEKRERLIGCQGCGRCKSACPTGGIFDKTKCVSCINQKKRLEGEDESVIKNSGMIWGCDVCQEVCPMNKGEETPIPFFRNHRIETLSEETLDTLIKSGEFQNRAYAWRGESVIRRNIKLKIEN